MTVIGLIMYISLLVKLDEVDDVLHHMSLFKMDVDKIEPIQLQGFYYRAKILIGREPARVVTNYLAREISKFNKSLVEFYVSEPPFFSKRICDGLNKLTIYQSRCVCCALVMGGDIDLAVNLTWQQVLDLRYNHSLTDVNELLLGKQLRYFNDNRVFWQVNPEGIIDLVEVAFNCKWSVLIEEYNTAIFYEPDILSELFRMGLIRF